MNIDIDRFVQVVMSFIVGATVGISVASFFTAIAFVWAISITVLFVWISRKYRVLRSETDIPAPLIDTPKKRANKPKRGDKQRKRKTK